MEGRIRFAVAEFQDYSREERHMLVWVSAAKATGKAGYHLEKEIADKVLVPVYDATRIGLGVLIQDILPEEEGLNADSIGVLFPLAAEGQSSDSGGEASRQGLEPPGLAAFPSEAACGTMTGDALEREERSLSLTQASSWDEVLDGAQIYDEPERSRLRRALDLARERFQQMEGKIRLAVAEYQDYSREERLMPLWVSAAAATGDAGYELEHELVEKVLLPVFRATRIRMPLLIQDILPEEEGLGPDSPGVLFP